MLFYFIGSHNEKILFSSYRRYTHYNDITKQIQSTQKGDNQMKTQNSDIKCAGVKVVMERYGVGKNTALALGDLAKAKIHFGRRTLYNISILDEWFDQQAGK